LLKCADLSNVAKIWPVSENWSNRVADEFFCQADFERDNKFPVAPFMDRTKTTRPRIAADFQDFVALPMFRVLAMFLPGAQLLMDLITINRQNWQQRLDDPTSNKPDVFSAPTAPATSSSTPQGEALDPPEDLTAQVPDDDEQQVPSDDNNDTTTTITTSTATHESTDDTFSSPSGPTPFFRSTPEPPTPTASSPPSIPS